MIDVLGPEKRRRRTTQEKIAIVQQSFEPGMTVSLVARQHGVAASQLFLWRKQYQEGSLTAVAAGEQVVPASELAAAMKQIKELLNRPGFPGECFICELRLPDHRFRWKHNKLFLLLPEGCGPAFPA
ncbi:transposase, partial [Shigella boydii]|uniref:transposase n=2 Tax=Shigella boydii TaxID=621 RepID=UPI001EECFFE3